jgi:tungstate transport system ATP-binding protein
MPEQAARLDFEAIPVPAATGLFPLEARSLSYAVSGRRLLDDLSFQIGARPVTVVMGPNGAGKSLLLRLLHGLIEPTGGQILWGGRPLSADLRRRQAMVFQRPVLLRRSVIANVAFALKSRGRASAGRCMELLGHVGLQDHANSPARRLSGGEQQQLALARALAVEPDVLFLDEPTASLGPSATAAIEAIVTAAHRQGTKIIFVTHNIGQARRLADEVLVLHQGRLVEHGPAGEFFASPRSPEAQGYIEGRLVF